MVIQIVVIIVLAILIYLLFNRIQLVRLYSPSGLYPNKIPANRVSQVPIGDVMQSIESEQLDRVYRFNAAGLPVIQRYISSTTLDDHKFMQHIEAAVDQWILTNPGLELVSITPIFIKETAQEAVVTVRVEMLYLGKPFHVQAVFYMVYHGDQADIQLVELKPISKTDLAADPGLDLTRVAS